MKSNLKLFIVFVFTGLFCFMFLGTVNASYTEAAFENEECISDMTFLNTAKSDYSFDATTGLFTVSGKTAQEYRTSSTTQDIKLTFYEVSSDGKTLTAYVPSYSSAISSDYTKSLLEEQGISSEYKCDNIIKVVKTSTSDGNATPTPTQTCDEGYIYDSTTGECVENSNTSVDKMESPNTASPASIAAVAAGCLLVFLAVYFYLKKSNNKKIN